MSEKLGQLPKEGINQELSQTLLSLKEELSGVEKREDEIKKI